MKLFKSQKVFIVSKEKDASLLRKRVFSGRFLYSQIYALFIYSLRIGSNPFFPVCLIPEGVYAESYYRKQRP